MKKALHFLLSCIVICAISSCGGNSSNHMKLQPSQTLTAGQEQQTKTNLNGFTMRVMVCSRAECSQITII